MKALSASEKELAKNYAVAIENKGELATEVEIQMLPIAKAVVDNQEITKNDLKKIRLALQLYRTEVAAKKKQTQLQDIVSAEIEQQRKDLSRKKKIIGGCMMAHDENSETPYLSVLLMAAIGVMSERDTTWLNIEVEQNKAKITDDDCLYIVSKNNDGYVYTLYENNMHKKSKTIKL